jgi:hypothetical protein
MGLLANLSPPSSLRFRTEGGGNWGGPPAGSGDCRRPGGRRRPGTGGKGRGGRGLSTPGLTLVGDGLKRGLRGKGGRR